MLSELYNRNCEQTRIFIAPFKSADASFAHTHTVIQVLVSYTSILQNTDCRGRELNHPSSSQWMTALHPEPWLTREGVQFSVVITGGSQTPAASVKPATPAKLDGYSP